MNHKIECPKCGFLITNNNFNRHILSCNGNGPRSFMRSNSPKIGSIELSEKISAGIKKAYCETNLKEKIRKGVLKAYKEGRLTGRASTEEKEKLRIKHLKETISINKKNGGLQKGSGRGKKGWYKGYWCDSSWELAYVIYCLDHNIFIKRNWTGFEYIFEEEKHKYYPDFILENNSFVEIKGIMSVKDFEKHRQFPYKLEVIEKNKIKPYLDYVEKNYGKNFIKLYKMEECDNGSQPASKTGGPKGLGSSSLPSSERDGS